MSATAYRASTSGLGNLRVILVLAAILLIIQVLGLLLSLVFGLLGVDVVEPLGFDQLVNLGGRKAGNELLRKTVVDGLA
jgi:hypothetical protein